MISISKKYAVVLFVLFFGGNCWAASSIFNRIDYVEPVHHEISSKLDKLSKDAPWRYSKESELFHSTRNPNLNETSFSLLLDSAAKADLTSLAFVLAKKIVNVNYTDQYGNFALKMALDGDKQESRKRDYAQRRCECVVLLLECGANPDLVCQGMLKKIQDPAIGPRGVARELIGFAQVKDCLKYAASAECNDDDNFPDDVVDIAGPTHEERLAALEATLKEENQ